MVTSQPPSLSPIPVDPAPVVVVVEAVTTPLALDDNARLQELYAEIHKIMTKQKGLIQSSPLPQIKSEDKKTEKEVPEQIAPMQIATNPLSPIAEFVKD